MVNKTSDDVSKRYIMFLAKCINRLTLLDAKPFILIHDTGSDNDIANDLLQSCDAEINIVHESDPLNIKGIIGCCNGMIGSRFHGLVSALSQGVPSLATGWSHKYLELLKDYNFEEGLLSFDMPDDKLFDLIDALADEHKSSIIKERINQAALNQKQNSQQMWSDIFTYINQYQY
jgi:colanic acid/amylovoran biosynthesis protein